MKQTIAFDNTSEYWKTRYSYAPSCMMHLDKLFFTSPNQKTEGDGRKPIYRHNDSSDGFNSFYNSSEHSLPSALAVSFNGFTARSFASSASNTTSSNKLFKSFSISGLNKSSAVTGLSLGASAFIVSNNNNLNSASEGLHNLSPLARRGNSVYGEIGKDFYMSGTNIKAIGKIKNVYLHFAYLDGDNIWTHLTPELDSNNPQPQDNLIINGLIVDADGFEAAPVLNNQKLYAFEIESFASNNPLPSSIFGGQAGEYTKFFSGRVNENNTMSAVPYVRIGPYEPVSARYQTNFAEASNFNEGESYSTYLSFGDPYSDATNSFKKGKFLLIAANTTTGSPHVYFERTPGAPAFGSAYPSFQFTWDPGPNDIQQFVAKGREYLFAMTPGVINGADPHGSFADAFVILGNTDFEISSMQVEFEYTEYDHGGKSSTKK